MSAPSDPPSAPFSDNDSDSHESRPMLSAFDGITSPSPSRPAFFSSLPALGDVVSSCCLSNSCACPRVGSSRVCNLALYRSHGFCIAGPHFPATVFITLFIGGATWFFGFAAIDAKDQLSQATGGGVNKPLHRSICVLFFFLTNALLYMTACADPGIVTGPKELPPEAAEDPSERSRWRFCEKCQIYQGPSVAHCNDCKVCIEELDHHCPWMSKCVGKGNMLWFKLFNLSWIVYFVYVLMRLFS